MSIYKIYALKEVGSSEIKYIGLTTKSLNERLGRHLRDKKIDHKTNWIKKVGRENIEIILLDDDINNFEELCEKEIYYIDKFKKEGHCLTNITNGGEGWFGIKFSESHRKNISINHADVSGTKNPMYGKSHSKETINKIKESKKAWIENVGFSKEQILKMKEKSFNFFKYQFTTQIMSQLSYKTRSSFCFM